MSCLVGGWVGLVGGCGGGRVLRGRRRYFCHHPKPDRPTTIRARQSPNKHTHAPTHLCSKMYPAHMTKFWLFCSVRVSHHTFCTPSSLVSAGVRSRTRRSQNIVTRVSTRARSKSSPWSASRSVWRSATTCRQPSSDTNPTPSSAALAADARPLISPLSPGGASGW